MRITYPDQLDDFRLPIDRLTRNSAVSRDIAGPSLADLLYAVNELEKKVGVNDSDEVDSIDYHLVALGESVDTIDSSLLAVNSTITSLTSRVSTLETPQFPLQIAVTNPTGSGAVTTLTLTIASRVGIPVVSAGRRMGRIWFSSSQWGVAGTISLIGGNLAVSCTTGTVVEGNGPTNINSTNLGIRHVAFDNGSAVFTLTASAPASTIGTAYIQAEVDGIVISQQFSYNLGHY